MSVRKRWLAKPWVQAVLARLISWLLRFIHGASRWTIVGGEHLEELRQKRAGFIAGFWHGRIMMMRFLWREATPFHILISPHRVGRLIAQAIAHLGVGAVAGSTTRGGAQGLRDVVKRLRAGDPIGITPDGPRGPRMRAKPGIAAAAALAQCPVLPVAYGVRRRRIARSWDSMLIPFPFNSGVYVIGAPIHPAPGEEIEALRLRIEAAMNAVTAEADRLCAAPAILPAPEGADARA
jgi:lysophospholipid acyltransferase (LPLAT)-like uncharacterized protein